MDALDGMDKRGQFLDELDKVDGVVTVRTNVMRRLSGRRLVNGERFACLQGLPGITLFHHAYVRPHDTPVLVHQQRDWSRIKPGASQGMRKNWDT